MNKWTQFSSSIKSGCEDTHDIYKTEMSKLNYSESGQWL